MIKEGKFGTTEAIFLCTTTITVKVCFTSPALIARYVGNASWYMTLISMTVAMAGFTFIYLLLKKYPEDDLVKIFIKVLGPFLGTVFSLIMAFFLIFSNSVLLREFVEVLKVFIFPDTPPGIIIVSMVVVVSIVCFFGLESLVRIARLMGYCLLVGFVSVIVLSATNYDYRNLFPILGNGFYQTLTHGIRRSSYYEEIILLAVFAPSLQGIRNIKKAGYISLLISGVLVSSSLFAFAMAFQYRYLQELLSPMYELTRIIAYGEFFERLDPVFIFIWSIGTIISISAIFLCFTSIYCKTIKAGDPKPLIIPSAILLLSLSLLPRDMATLLEVYLAPLREYGWIVVFGLPLFTLIVAEIRERKGVESKNV